MHKFTGNNKVPYIHPIVYRHDIIGFRTVVDRLWNPALVSHNLKLNVAVIRTRCVLLFFRHGKYGVVQNTTV